MSQNESGNSKNSSDNQDVMVTLTMSKEQARAVSHALDLYSRVCLGQLEEIASLHRHNIITPTDRIQKSTSESIRISDELDQVMAKAKSLLGFLPGSSFAIGSQNVHISGKRSYEIKKVLDQVIAYHDDPNPSFKGVHYDGLSVRYTNDKMPTAKIS